MVPSQAQLLAFDCHGFTVLRSLIPEAAVQAARELIESQYGGRPPWKFPVLDLGRAFWEFMTQPAVLGLASALCGRGFRLDHAFGLSSNDAAPQLHGGPGSSLGSCDVQWLGGTEISVTQLSVGVVLSGQGRATGGFCYIPGSHKTAFRQMEGKQIYLSVLGSDLSDRDLVVVPDLHPGDVVVFSESLYHGDTGWQASGHRLSVYYKFAPGHVAWRDPAQQEKFRPMATTDLERRLLRPPWSGRFGDDGRLMDTANERRSGTLE